MKKTLASILSIAILATGSAMAQDTSQTTSLYLELNALQSGETGCRITFLAKNSLGAALDSAAFEVALFDANGAIDQLVTLDFNALAAGKTKVLQFELPELECSNVGRVLINDAPSCTGEGIEPSACLDHLETSTKVDVTFGI